jgi:hypothetical protein
MGLAEKEAMGFRYRLQSGHWLVAAPLVGHPLEGAAVGRSFLGSFDNLCVHCIQFSGLVFPLPALQQDVLRRHVVLQTAEPLALDVLCLSM